MQPWLACNSWSFCFNFWSVFGYRSVFPRPVSDRGGCNEMMRVVSNPARLDVQTEEELWIPSGAWERPWEGKQKKTGICKPRGVWNTIWTFSFLNNELTKCVPVEPQERSAALASYCASLSVVVIIGNFTGFRVMQEIGEAHQYSPQED